MRPPSASPANRAIASFDFDLMTTSGGRKRTVCPSITQRKQQQALAHRRRSMFASHLGQRPVRGISQYSHTQHQALPRILGNPGIIPLQRVELADDSVRRGLRHFSNQLLLFNHIQGSQCGGAGHRIGAVGYRPATWHALGAINSARRPIALTRESHCQDPWAVTTTSGRTPQCYSCSTEDGRCAHSQPWTSSLSKNAIWLLQSSPPAHKGAVGGVIAIFTLNGSMQYCGRQSLGADWVLRMIKVH